MALSRSESDLLGDRCLSLHRFFSPHRSFLPTGEPLLSVVLLFNGSFFCLGLSSTVFSSHLLGSNRNRKPPWTDSYKYMSLFSLFPPLSLDTDRRTPVLTMAEKLRKNVQNLSLGIDDVPVSLPPEIVARAASINQFSLVVTTVNPRKQNLRALIGQMPRVWGLVDSCVGRILSPGKVQFKFRNEESMNLVLHRGPWSFNDWMLTVHRWFPNITEETMKIIPFWVRIHGIPTLYLTNAMARFIGNQLGPVADVDFDENVNNVGFVRVQLHWNCDEPLRFQRNFQFTADENTIITFQFERLRNFCTKCGSLRHDLKECDLAFDDENSGDDNDDDAGSGDESMSETNTLATIDPVNLIPGLQSTPPAFTDVSVTSPTPSASVSSSPRFSEDTDLTAERIRYLHAKFTRAAMNDPMTEKIGIHSATLILC